LKKEAVKHVLYILYWAEREGGDDNNVGAGRQVAGREKEGGGEIFNEWAGERAVNAEKGK